MKPRVPISAPAGLPGAGTTGAARSPDRRARGSRCTGTARSRRRACSPSSLSGLPRSESSVSSPRLQMKRSDVPRAVHVPDVDLRPGHGRVLALGRLGDAALAAVRALTRRETVAPGVARLERAEVAVELALHARRPGRAGHAAPAGADVAERARVEVVAGGRVVGEHAGAGGVARPVGARVEVAEARRSRRASSGCVQRPAPSHTSSWHSMPSLQQDVPAAFGV